MKHLLVTGNKMKSLYTRKKPLEKDPHTTLVVEIKCPFKGKDLDLKIAFLLPTVSREKGNLWEFFLVKNHLHYIQVQTGMAISGLKTCHFVTYTSERIFIVTINLNLVLGNCCSTSLQVLLSANSSFFPNGSLT